MSRVSSRQIPWKWKQKKVAMHKLDIVGVKKAGQDKGSMEKRMIIVTLRQASLLTLDILSYTGCTLYTSMSAMWHVLYRPVKNYTEKLQKRPVLIAANHKLSNREDYKNACIHTSLTTSTCLQKYDNVCMVCCKTNNSTWSFLQCKPICIPSWSKNWKMQDSGWYSLLFSKNTKVCNTMSI